MFLFFRLRDKADNFFLGLLNQLYIKIIIMGAIFETQELQLKLFEVSQSNKNFSHSNESDYLMTESFQSCGGERFLTRHLSSSVLQIVNEASLTAGGFLNEDGSGSVVGLQDLAELESACLATARGDVILYNFNSGQVSRGHLKQWLQLHWIIRFSFNIK